MRTRIKNWVRRYLPAEIGGHLGLFAGAYLGQLATGSEIVAAFAATWGANAGYYGIMLVTEMRQQIENGRANPWGYCVRNLLLEFGVSEIMDSFLTRPALVYAGMQIFDSMFWGVLIGGIAADLLFYLPTVFAYELRKKYLSN